MGTDASNVGSAAPANSPARSIWQRWRNVAVALSLAHLCFIHSWFAILYDIDNGYFNKVPVTTATLLALACNILGLTVLLSLIARGIARSHRPSLQAVGVIGICLLLLIPLNFVRHNYLSVAGTRLIAFLKSPLGMMVVVLALAAPWRWHRQALRVTTRLLLILLPLTALTFGKIILLLLHVQTLHQFAGGQNVLPPPLHTNPQPHLVYLILDELDQRVAFEQRPPGVALPELDRLLGESIHATNAFPPAGSTRLSLPALTTGRLVSEAIPTTPSDLTLTFQSPTTNAIGRWGVQSNLFSDARALGVNTALVGWFHPYARVLGSSLNYCVWYPYPPFETSRASTFTGTLLNQIWSMATPLQHRRLHRTVCEVSFRESIQIVTNAQFGLVLLHLPVPHPPGVYVPATDQFTVTSFATARGYFDNLVLADRVLGKLRRAMEEAGIWERTWLLVTSDHWWRDVWAYDGKLDYRVPFILRVPGGTGRSYGRNFNTVLTRDLIGSILRREVVSADEVTTWLEQHGLPSRPVSTGDYHNR